MKLLNFESMVQGDNSEAEKQATREATAAAIDAALKMAVEYGCCAAISMNSAGHSTVQVEVHETEHASNDTQNILVSVVKLA